VADAWLLFVGQFLSGTMTAIAKQSDFWRNRILGTHWRLRRGVIMKLICFERDRSDTVMGPGSGIVSGQPLAR